MGGAFGDPDLARDLAQPHVGVVGQQGEHMQMIREEHPVPHAPVYRPRGRATESSWYYGSALIWLVSQALVD